MFIESLLLWIPPLVVAVVLHEVAHGVVAKWLGDPTAHHMGRLSLNPIKHVDFFGTFLIPLMLFLAKSPFMFGYAKPVPVDFNAVCRKNGRHAMAYVALAGPAMNFFLCVLSLGVLKEVVTLPASSLSLMFQEMLFISVKMNLALGLFNLLPILPLDGGRVVSAFLPAGLAQSWGRLEPFGFPILLFLLAGLPALTGVNVVAQLLSQGSSFFLNLFL